MGSQQHKCTFTLTCVRHGETEANVVGLVQGQGVDSSINKKGRAQSEKIGRRLCDEKFDLILSSDLKRAHQTCEIILEKNRLSGKSIVFDLLLRERCFGVMEGRYYYELENVAFPSENTEESNLPEGAESLRELENRANKFFQNLCWKISDLDSSNNINVLLVSHGGLLACLFNCFSGIYGCQFPQGVNPGHISVNTCMSRFEVTCNPTPTSRTINNLVIKCLCINDGSHLHAS